MKKLNKYLVTVENGICFDIWATDVDILEEKNIVYFWNDNRSVKVACFGLNDIDDISLFIQSPDHNLFMTIYER